MTERDAWSDGTAGTTRRRFIQVVAGGAVAAPLVGCVDDDNDDVGDGGGGSPPTTERPGGTPTTTIAPEPPATPAPQETWVEPWVWRPHEWPGQQLHLNVVENENPGPIVGFGNPAAVLFSYNGATPGPTIRMRGDETLFLRLRNHLGLDQGSTFTGPFPDLAGGARPPYFSAGMATGKAAARAAALGQPAQPRSDFCLGEHTNGVHAVHVTNLHTHGLHVRPGRNPDGTHSDNVILRLTTQPDFRRREDSAFDPTCAFLRPDDATGFLMDDEQVGFADYEFRIGNVQAELMERLGLPPQPHPPGTHWYHPHSHGATHDQVASGMAGFLIVEGDVDEAINLALTGERRPDPQIKTGRYGYIERLMFIQRVSPLNISRDPDAAPGSTLRQAGPRQVVAAVNGDQRPRTIVMRPGDIERWRVLNGSVDGRGYKRFQVLRGDFQVDESATGDQLRRWNPETEGYEPVSRSETAEAKQPLFQLAFDGVTLVEGDADDARYTIKDLGTQGDGPNPLNQDFEFPDQPNRSMLKNFEDCYTSPSNVRNCYVQPNEVYLAPANRTDVFFQAPEETDVVYTVLAKAVIVHADNYQSGLQAGYDEPELRTPPEDIVVAYVRVPKDATPRRDDPDLGGDELDSVLDLIDRLPPVPPYLRPIDDDEVRVQEGDPDDGLHPGKFRTRTITYSGWGAADFPLVTTVAANDPGSLQNPATADAFREFVDDDQALGPDASLEDLRYTKILTRASGDDPWEPLMHDGEEQYVLLPANIRTMAITGSTSDEPVDGGVVPGRRGRKFDPMDPQHPRMLAGTAEQWALHNDSIMLWADTADGRQPIGQFQAHYSAAPMTRAEATAVRDEGNLSWQIAAKSVDHPFHIHQNPCWVTSIEVPDENGELVDILDAPRWQDVMWIPRNTGRVVFRSRFPDYVGAYVEHCHILLHEDNGMMQLIEVTPFATKANYEPADSLDVDGRHDLGDAWAQSMQFFDPNALTGQDYPGFPVTPPVTL